MNPLLNEIYSIINGYANAKDNERVFTFIEFVKQFGYDNDTDIFINAYKDYVIQWSIVKKDSINISTEDFVITRLIDVLKSITLDYSSYEEQDFIGHIDFTNKEHLKGLCALYSRKIKQIAEYYRTKRNETAQIVNKNAIKGTIKSIQEIIYEKIFDFVFSNRNIVPSFNNLKRDLIVSVENYVDTYSDYFDIPREQKVDEDSRSKLLNQLLEELEAQSAATENDYISSDFEDSSENQPVQARFMMRAASDEDVVEEVEEDTSSNTVTTNTSTSSTNTQTSNSAADKANMNDIDYRVFLDDTSLLMSDLLFSGDVHLKELPLIAQISVDFSEQCVGNKLALKNQLLKDVTVNNVTLQEQVELKKKLYEKFVGVDLWYVYVGENGDVKMDVLVKSQNPTGNILNVGSADTATIEKSDGGALNQNYGGSGSGTGAGSGAGSGSGTGTGSGSGTGGGTGSSGTSGGAGTIGGGSGSGSGSGAGTIGGSSSSGSGAGTIGGGSSGSGTGGIISGSGVSSGGGSGSSGGGDDGINKDPASSFNNNNSHSSNVGFYGQSDTSSDANDGYLELLSRIGLFFKPDKTSILTVNSKDYTWSIDTEALIPDTIYVFPDPDKYGDIGNNKNPLYPLIMEHKLDYDIKNITSGFSQNDPIVHLSNQGWYSYYSKQQDDFKIYENKDYEYSLTSLANLGFITNYQTDIWGNEFGILKGFKIDNQNKTIIINSKYNEYEMKNDTHDVTTNTEGKYLLLNGGYFRDPFNLTNTEKGGFDFRRKMVVIDKDDEKYILSGLSINNKNFYHPAGTSIINFGQFPVDNTGIKDHFRTQIEKNEEAKKDGIITVTNTDFLSSNVYSDYKIEVSDETFDENLEGELYVKLLGQKPKKFSEVFTQQVFNFDTNFNNEEIINFHIVAKNIIVETKDNYYFLHYGYNGDTVSDQRNIIETYTIPKNKIEYKILGDGQKYEDEETTLEKNVVYNEMIYNENDKCFYILLIEKIKCEIYRGETSNEDGEFEVNKEFRNYLVPRIYKFDCENYTMTDILYPYDCVCYNQFIEAEIHREKSFKDRMGKKDTISFEPTNFEIFKNILTSQHYEEGYENLSDFEIPYDGNDEMKINEASFSYNNNTETFLIAYTLKDLNGTPYIYQHKFKLGDIDTFNDTLQSRLYTLVSDGGSYKWNNELNAIYVNVLPSNNESVLKNTIFVPYDGVGDANDGIDDGITKIHKLNQVEDVWKSTVYDWDNLGYSVITDASIGGKIRWSNTTGTFEIRTNKNTFKFNFDGLYVMIKNERITINNSEFFEIDIYRDVLGNVSGSKTVRIIKEDVDNAPEGFVRHLILDLNVEVYGNSDNLDVTVTAIGKDFKEIKLSGGDVIEDSNQIDNVNHVKINFKSNIQDYDNITQITTKNETKTIACNGFSFEFVKKVNGEYIKDELKKQFEKGDNLCRITIERGDLLVKDDDKSYVLAPMIKNEDGSYTFTEKGISFITNIHISSNSTKVNGDIIDEESHIIGVLNSTSNDVITSKDGQISASSFFENGWLTMEYTITLLICSCDYSCFIGYNKHGLPIKFELSALENASSLFSDTVGVGMPWVFENEDGSAINMNTKSMNSICHNSRCASFKVKNSAVRDLTSAFSFCPKLLNIKFESSTEDVDNVLKAVIKSRHMFMDTYPNSENMKFIGYSQDEIKQVVEMAGQTKASFVYSMDSLRNAESMFYKRYNVFKKDDNTLGRKNINENNLNFNKERLCDFEEIKIQTPSLVSAPMMFWNRPLTVDEANVFIDALPDVTEIRNELTAWLDKEFESICDEYKDDQNLFANIDTKVDGWIDSISWSKKIEVLSKLTHDYEIISKVENGVRYYYFPSISIWLHEDAAKNEDIKRKLINLAKKGWEVSTNASINTNEVKKISANNNNYVIRAYEYGVSSGEPLMCDEELMTSATNNVDYMVDICKTVLNPIVCDSYDAWVKLCMIWQGTGTSSGHSERKKYRLAQILGDVPQIGYGTVSKATLFDGNSNGRYCKNTWFNGSVDDFRRNYRLYFKYR